MKKLLFHRDETKVLNAQNFCFMHKKQTAAWVKDGQESRVTVVFDDQKAGNSGRYRLVVVDVFLSTTIVEMLCVRGF